MKQLPPAFHGLSRYKQFITYMLVPSVRTPGATDKIPVHPATLNAVNPLDRDQWMTAEQACAAAASMPVDGGVGFVLTQADPFFFLDIDKCLGADGKWSTRAQQLLAHFAGAAVEVSQSGKGLHIIGSGVCPPHACKDTCKPKEHLELYTESRFIALTGQFTDGSVDADMTSKLPWLVDNFFTRRGPEPGEITEWTHQPVPEWNGPWDDDILIEKARSTQSALQVFGHRASFADLFDGNEERLAAAYPSSTGDSYDRSSADMALASHLAFWTGKNCERMYNLMLRSGLMREKWEREEYLRTTIQNACRMQGGVYSVDYKLGQTRPPAQAESRVPMVPSVPGSQLPALSGGSEQREASVQFMPASAQAEYFAGCVYVRNQHKVLVPDGTLLKPDQFRAMFSGYDFALDATNRKTTRSAWEVFIESQAFKFPKVNRSVFRPERPPLQIFQEDGEPVVNSYVPVETKRREGEPTPFLDLIARLLPDDRDREILLSYMAAIVQYPGIKFKWCPILQGAEGNGKTTLLRCVAFAVGSRYAHFPSAPDLANKFNSWIEGKLFIGINEIFVEDQREMRDVLYDMIDCEDIEIQRKGQDKERTDNRANFMASTNNKAAVKATRDTRRWCIFYTAQQCEADIKRDGMGGSYFAHLWRWLRDEHGFEIVNNYLREYHIADEFNPAGAAIRAPWTTATAEAVDLSAGRIEQEVMEAIEQEVPGFRKGWVSSLALDKLLEQKGLAKFIPRNRRRELMQAVGYDWHPTLEPWNGRLTQFIIQEGGRPILFARKIQPPWAQTPVEVKNRYLADQGYAPPVKYEITGVPNAV